MENFYIRDLLRSILRVFLNISTSLKSMNQGEAKTVLEAVKLDDLTLDDSLIR